MIRRVSKYTMYVLLLVLFLSFALAGLLAVRLHMAPINLTKFLPYVENRLVFYNYALEMDDLVMSYDGRLVVSGSNVRVVHKDTRDGVLNLEQTTLRFSNSNLLRAKFVPREVYAKGLRLTAELSETELKIGDSYTLPLSGDSKEIQVNVPLVAFMEEMHGHVSLSGWQNFDIEDAQIQFKDARKDVAWAFTDAHIRLESDFEAFTGELAGVVKRSGASEHVPLSVNMSHIWGEKTLKLESSFDELSGDLLRGYIPAHFNEMVKSRISGKVSTLWNDITLFDGLRVMIQAPETTLSLPRVFAEPLTLASISLDGEVSVNRFGRLSINNLEAVDPAGVVFTASGDVSKFLSEDPVLDISLKVSDADLKTMLSYVPDTVSPNGIKWVNEHLNMDAKVKNFLLTFAPSAPMPFCAEECGIELQFDFEGLKVSGIKTLPEATGLNGRFNLGNNEIRVTAPRGMMSAQAATGIVVVLDELFSTKESYVNVSLQAAGPADEVVSQVKALVPDSKVPDLKGSHVSDVKLKISTRKEHADDITYDVSSTLSDLSFNIPGEDVVLKTDAAFFNGKNGYSYFKSDEADIDGMPVSMVWYQEKKGSDQHQTMELSGTQVPEKLLKGIAEEYVSAKGRIPFTLKLMQKNDDAQRFWVSSDLMKNTLDFKVLSWKKGAGERLFVKAEGVLSKGKDIQIRAIDVSGEHAMVKGKASLNLADKNALPHFSFERLQLGDNNNLTSLQFDGVSFKAKGSSLDIRNLLVKKNAAGKSAQEAKPDSVFDIANFTADVEFEKLILAGGNAWTNVKGQAHKQGKYWRDAELNGLIEGGDDVTVIYDDNTAENKGVFSKKLQVSSTRAGMFFRSLGMYEHMRGGSARVTGYFTEDMSRARGHFAFNDVRVVNAPLLVKLISFLSLEELLSSQSGIKFSEVKGEFRYKDDNLAFPILTASGPSIGLRAVAATHLKEKALAVRGQMIPAEGLNKVVSSIPLVGTILTGSQEGLSVANFSIIGPMANPSVSSNPLSLLTPGLVKDFFSGLMGSDSNSVETVQKDLNNYLKKQRGNK